MPAALVQRVAFAAWFAWLAWVAWAHATGGGPEQRAG
jgi:hypothetical protein